LSLASCRNLGDNVDGGLEGEMVQGVKLSLDVRKRIMDLREIARLEDEWLSKMSSERFRGGDAVFEEMGVYAAWRMIFEQYVLLATDGDVEALKRALFLTWYGLAEPSWLCGIKDLDDKLITQVFQMVNALVETDELDAELRWMLPWYYHIAPYYLDLSDDLNALKQVSRGRWDSYQELYMESSFEGRGQLGQYWRSIQKRFVWP
jgi:hypothetical protein